MKNMFLNTKIALMYRDKKALIVSILIFVVMIVATLSVYLTSEFFDTVHYFMIVLVLEMLIFNRLMFVPRISSVFFDFVALNKNVTSKKLNRFTLSFSKIFIVQSVVITLVVLYGFLGPQVTSNLKALVIALTTGIFFYVLSYSWLVSSCIKKLFGFNESCFNESFIQNHPFGIINTVNCTFLFNAYILEKPIFDLIALCSICITLIIILIVPKNTFWDRYEKKSKIFYSNFNVTILGAGNTTIVEDTNICINKGINKINHPHSNLILDTLKLKNVEVYRTFWEANTSDTLENIAQIRNLSHYYSLSFEEYIKLMFGENINSNTTLDELAVLKYLGENEVKNVLVNCSVLTPSKLLYSEIELTNTFESVTLSTNK